jgi:hypothetical protein
MSKSSRHVSNGPRQPRVFTYSGGRVTAQPVRLPRAARPDIPATDEEIRRRAYFLWEASGKPEGDGVCFWLMAERELRA